MQLKHRSSPERLRTLKIEKRYYESQKVGDADLRWLIQRSHRLTVADDILTENGYVIDEPGYQLPISG